MAALAELHRLAGVLSADLSARGVEHFVSGSVASSLDGQPRTTFDLHVVVTVEPDRLRHVFAAARALGLAGEDIDLLAQIQKRRYAQMHAGPLTLDVTVPGSARHVVRRRRAVQLPRGGNEVPWGTPEDLFVMKCVLSGPHDHADLHVLAARGDRLDRGYITARLDELLPAGDRRRAEADRILDSA